MNKLITLFFIIFLFGIISCNSIVRVQNKSLRRELLQMEKEDQATYEKIIEHNRQKIKESKGNNVNIINENSAPYKTQKQVFSNNAKRMKEIIKTYGWPTYDLVGKDGSEAAWLLVQHGDLELQKMSINLLKNAVEANQASKRNYAYLLDRILVREGKKQIYGTQIDFKNGKYIPYPIEDKANVDKRRKEMGMESLQEYLNDYGEIIIMPFDEE